MSIISKTRASILSTFRWILSQEDSWFLLPASPSDQSSSECGPQTGLFCPSVVRDKWNTEIESKEFKILRQYDSNFRSAESDKKWDCDICIFYFIFQLLQNPSLKFFKKENLILHHRWFKETAWHHIQTAWICSKQDRLKPGTLLDTVLGWEEFDKNGFAAADLK